MSNSEHTTIRLADDRARRTCWDSKSANFQGDLTVAVVTQRIINPDEPVLRKQDIVFDLKIFAEDVACFDDKDHACKVRDLINKSILRTQNGEGVLRATHYFS